MNICKSRLERHRLHNLQTLAEIGKQVRCQVAWSHYLTLRGRPGERPVFLKKLIERGRRAMLLWGFCLMAAVMAVAQDNLIPDMKFRRLDTRDGLSHSQVNSVLRDSRGFIWFATPYGLNRYDGYRFKTFYSNLRDTTSMRDNYVDELYEGFDGKIWIKHGMNYSVLDPKTERFERNVARELAKYGIKGSVEYLYIDEDKNFWVKPYEEGFYYYNPTTKVLKQGRLGYEKGEMNPTYAVSDFAMLGKQLVITTPNGDLLCLDGPQGEVVWEDNYVRQNVGTLDQDYDLYIDNEQNYWIMNVTNDFIYIKKEKRWYRSMVDYLRAHGIENVPDELDVWDVAIDRYGLLWFVTDHMGLFVADVKNKQIKQFLNDKNDEKSVSENTLRHVYLDPAGQVWIASYKNGLNQYSENVAGFTNLEVGDVTTTCEDKYGNYWFGTNDRGFIVYDPRSGEQAHYDVHNSGLSSNVMVGCCRTHDGSIWYGSYNGGLVHCVMPNGDPKQGVKVVNYRADTPGGLANNNVWSVTEDRWHRIWLGTLGGGVQMLDPKTGKFRTWNTQNSKLTSDYLTTASWTKKGWLLMGSSHFYALVNPVKYTVLNMNIPGALELSQSTQSTVCVMEDSRGLIWQGSTSGVCVYDPKTRVLKLLDITKGLIGSSVCGICEDRSHSMWVVTDHGLSKVIPEQQKDGTWQFIVSSFNQREGLLNATFNQRSMWVTAEGKILIGGQSGVDIIDPAHLDAGRDNETPLFSGLMLFDEEVSVGSKVDGRVILDEALDICRELNLKYDENNFTIQLGSNAGKVNNRKRFIYQLEGFRDSWIKTSEQNPNITFMSLDNGEYKLRVRMLNDDGTLGKNESVLLIHVYPPLWRSPWVVAFYVLSLVVVVWWLRRSFLKRHKERQQLEELRRETEKRQWMNDVMQQVEHQHDNAAEGNGAYALQPVQLNTMRIDLVSRLREYCNGIEIPNGKRVTCKFKPLTTELRAEVDPVQLSHALNILVGNSIKFAPSGCRIVISVERTEDGRAKISVADNGIGIRNEFKATAFDRNDQGIGLDKVKAIVDAHNGEISLLDNPGGGTLIVISLPTVQPANDIIEAEIIEE